MRKYVWFATVLALFLYANTGTAQTTIPTISSGGIVNAASLAADTTNLAAPGSMISIFGKNLARATASANGSPLPYNISGTVVQIGNVFAPLLFVSPTQINAQVPF